MKILHYSLGFPPFRSGGMTTYCLDLMKEQRKSGHYVGMLWPGAYSIINKKTRICKRKDYQLGVDIFCDSYELINGLPVAMLDGIQNSEAFTRHINSNTFRNFLSKHQFEIFHVHTLMGLPMEYVCVANELGVRTVFTTHDYFGICSKWGLFTGGQLCKNDMECRKCIECNETALSLWKISILQSSVYRSVKNSFMVKILRKWHNEKLYVNNSVNEATVKEELCDVSVAAKYQKLRNYYIDLLKAFNVLHFNSSITSSVYQKYIGKVGNGVVLNVCHSQIGNYVRRKKVGEVVNIGYLGSITIHKGYFFAAEVLKRLYKCGTTNFRLHVFNEFDHELPFLINHPPYNYYELEKIMDDLDLLIMPSQWYETFGFTILEALSYGVPVIVSENVGAQDLVIQGKNGYVIKNNYDEWQEKLKALLENLEMLDDWNYNIFESFCVPKFCEHAVSVTNELYKFHQ